jgi:hypothetical protein
MAQTQDISGRGINLKGVIEPRMNTDEARINNRLSSNCAYTIQVTINPHVICRFICVNPCSSVANKGFWDQAGFFDFVHVNKKAPESGAFLFAARQRLISAFQCPAS